MTVSRYLLSTPTPILNHLDSRQPLFAPVKHFIVPNCLYSYYDMMTFGTQASPKRRSWIFFKAPTKLERIWHIGIARHWKGRYSPQHSYVTILLSIRVSLLNVRRKH